MQMVASVGLIAEAIQPDGMGGIALLKLTKHLGKIARDIGEIVRCFTEHGLVTEAGLRLGRDTSPGSGRWRRPAF